MPLFKAMAQDGKEYSSSDLLGKKTIIYAYPKDNTPGCTAQAVNLRDNYRELLAQGYQLFGISRDSIESHIKFAGKYDLPFPLLSDPDHVILEQLGAWGEKKLYGRTFMGIERATFLIDGKGRIAHVWRKVKVPGHVEDVLKMVKAQTTK